MSDPHFKGRATAELAAIKARLLWLLMPACLIAVVVLGLGVLTWMQTSEVREQTKLTDKAVQDLQKALKAKQADANLRIEPNGFSAEERAEFYHLAEGSEVFPLDWLKALEDSKTKKPFMDRLESLGFIPDPQNVYGLPIGLTADTARGLEPFGKMVGLTCAACHVGEMTYQGKRLRIDGAPNLVDTREFFASLVESSFATLEDSDKLIAFIGRVKKNRADEKSADANVRLGARLIELLKDKSEKVLIHALAPVIKKIADDETAIKDDKHTFLIATLKDAGKDAKAIRTKWLEAFDRSKTKALLENSALKKRFDEFAKDADHEGTLLHTLEEIYIGVRLLKARAEFLKKLGMVGTNKKTVWGPGRVDAFGSARAFLFEDGYAPVNAVSYPAIWGLYRVDWFHYDNNTTSILQRNFGQALGVGAVYDPDTKSSSLRPANLYRLEQLATKLKPPQWPEDLFGKIDQDSAARGKAHFKEHCLKCHATPEGKDMFKDELFETKDTGTDPFRARMFAQELPISTDRPKVVAFSKAIGDTMEIILQKSLDDHNVSKEDREKFAKGPGGELVKVNWRGPGKYAARPLNGIWATGPFLHNGSVPTIDDLLKPAKDRLPVFYVGNREFDPVKLGYVSTPPEGTVNNFDTGTDGNRNTGHEYGIKLSDAERKDLLEYLKSL